MFYSDVLYFVEQLIGSHFIYVLLFHRPMICFRRCMYLIIVVFWVQMFYSDVFIDLDDCDRCDGLYDMVLKNLASYIYVFKQYTALLTRSFKLRVIVKSALLKN